MDNRPKNSMEGVKIFSNLFDMACHLPFEEIMTIIEINAPKYVFFSNISTQCVDRASYVLKKWEKRTKMAANNIIEAVGKNVQNKRKESEDVEQATIETPLIKLLAPLKVVIRLFREVAQAIAGKRIKWESLSLDDQNKIRDANHVLNQWKKRGSEAIVDLMCAIVPTEVKGENRKSKCVDFVLSYYKRYTMAKAMLFKMADLHPKAFLPHIETICAMMDDLIRMYGRIYFNTGTSEQRSFVYAVMKMLPTLVAECENKHKYQVYQMLLQVVDGSRGLIGEDQLTSIWKSLEHGINDSNEYARCGAYDAFIHFATHSYTKIVKSEFKEKVYINLLQLVEIYCVGNRTGVIQLEDGNDKRLFKAFQNYCEQLEDSFEMHLKNTMNRLLNAFNPSFMERTSPHVIASIVVVFELAEKLEAYLPQFTEKFTIFLTKMASEHINFYSKSQLAAVADAIGNGKFMRFFVGIALKLLQETKDHEFRAGSYALFDAIVLKREIELDVFMPKLVLRLTSSAKLKEAEAAANVLMEKKQAISSLNLMAWRTGKAFLPYIQLCFQAVYDQLNHSDESIRQISIETVAQFVTFFFKMDKVERSQQTAAQIIPDFAKMLKTDSLTIAITIVEAYRKLLREAAIVFMGEIKLVDKLFNCVDDVMRAKLACQATTDFYDNKQLIAAALDIFMKLGQLIEPFEFAVFFVSILPILTEKLERAKQLNSENTKIFRTTIYHTLSESVRVMKAYSSTSFDALLPIFLAGMHAEHPFERRNAALGLGILMTYSTEDAKEKSAEIAQVFSKFWANERCAELVSATSAKIAGIVLPELVEKLKEGAMRDQIEDTFKCFMALMKVKNAVLLNMMRPIIVIAFDLLSHNLDQAASEAIVAFLRESRIRVSQIVEQALDEFPQAANIIQTL